ncbi:hypothetical protein G647_02088 [Cladophialophora carrionii CBS 160.54]|uniref:Uncharacterized protein n=1 Tax=Cladophialophora carrionii CBS 160.54 TaxID=1279043 RepID=V9DF48_9EURO|nr:uncharacterized protein G647_02088 [Cladophialophora carrionii CBS 160.54]ETI25316.1 hypothetical protein G647_02088 [Cladophialophora carrionii CBS 160.54]
MKALQAANTAAGGPIRPESGAYIAAQGDPKHMSVATTGIDSPTMQQQQLYGTPSQHGFSPAFGYGAPQMQPAMVQHDQYGNPYGIQPIGMGYPGMSPYPQAQSPPPPFYASGGTYDQGHYKPPAEVAGDVMHPVPVNRQSTGMSDTQSQVTSTTAATGSHHQQGGEPRPPAELSSQGSVRY